MKCGISIANFGVSSKPQDYGKLAKAAEDSGWDGLFVWDHLNFGRGINVLDPWILLATIALKTETMRIGTAVTPLPRRRPQKLACEVATLDQLSEGRMILGVGLGWPPKEFKAFGEESDIHIRAQKTDESLEIIQGLWSGDTFSFRGKHFTVDNFKLHPTPVQKPRVPIWVAGMWPKKKPFRRAAQYDGVVPLGTKEPSTFAKMKEYTEKHRRAKGEYAWVGSLTHPSKVKRDELLPQFEEAGANWYLESWGTVPIEKQMQRTKRGPPDI
jgi:alkanesulfonate monooxygenase SsuD/methylene tetrahydromethanopterin reductase-like flavin-dependent oxidoreductase (luciferase family)